MGNQPYPGRRYDIIRKTVSHRDEDLKKSDKPAAKRSAEKPKASRTTPEHSLQYTVAFVPVRGKKKELCGQECPLLDMSNEPWLCRRNPQAPDKLRVDRKGAYRTATCIKSGEFVRNAKARSFISQIVGGI